MAGHEVGLDEEEESYRNALIEVGVSNFFLFPRLVFDENCFPRIIVHGDSPVGRLREAFWIHLATIDQGKDETVGDSGTELFHEIEGQSRTAWPVAMEEADGGIEADGFDSRADVVHEECVDKG